MPVGPSDGFGGAPECTDRKACDDERERALELHHGADLLAERTDQLAELAATL